MVNIGPPLPVSPPVPAKTHPAVMSGGAIPGTSITHWVYNTVDSKYRYYTANGWSESSNTPSQVQATKGTLTDTANGKMGDAGSAVGGVLSESEAKALNDATNWTNPANWIPAILSWLASAGITVGAFIAGVALVILGVVFLIGNTKVGKEAAGVAALA